MFVFFVVVFVVLCFFCFLICRYKPRWAQGGPSAVHVFGFMQALLVGFPEKNQQLLLLIKFRTLVILEHCATMRVTCTSCTSIAHGMPKRVQQTPFQCLSEAGSYRLRWHYYSHCESHSSHSSFVQWRHTQPCHEVSHARALRESPREALVELLPSSSPKSAKG